MAPTRILAAWLGLVAALLGPLGAPPPRAHADAVDDAFLSELRSKSINFASPQAAVVAAHEACDELHLGRTPPQVATEVTRNSNLDGYHAGFFVGLAIHTYCPQFAS